MQHYRNFLGEMPFQATLKGFHELSPYRIAHELFADLSPGDKIAITTRFIDKNPESYKTISEIARHLELRGFRVRVVGNQTGVEDFCFLQKAQKELVGTGLSSFVRWAAYLGQASNIRLYFLNENGNSSISPTKWNHPQRSPDVRIKYEYFTLDSS
jgi:hypothetical protein